jgi:Protein of unknown function (DUF5672)
MYSGLIRRRVYLPDITLVCVSGVKSFKSLFSLYRSANKCNFAKIVFVSTKFPEIKIGKFSIEKPSSTLLQSINDYNWYCIYELHKHVHTSHALVVQYDSAVLHSDEWRKEFLDYDYIGAPWPVANDSYIDPFGNSQRVGNGGFSLRSRKLMKVPNIRNIPWDVVEDGFYKTFNTKLLSEDGNICVHNRHLYELEGCKFAPIEVAAHFSYENDVPENFGIKPFGFHKNNLWSIRKRVRKQISKLLPR